MKPKAGDTPANALAARAMDHLLASGRDSQERIAECQRRRQERIEAACAERRSILPRARIVALDIRAAETLGECTAAILAAARQEADQAAAASPPARVDTALERHARRSFSPEAP